MNRSFLIPACDSSARAGVRPPIFSPVTPTDWSEAVAQFASRRARIEERLVAACRRANRDPQEIRVIWVSKNHPVSALIAAQAAGARLFGENRAQEVLEKFPLRAADGTVLDHDLHFIGHLQRNKARKVLPLCTAVHSVDSAELWQTLERIAAELGIWREVFLQVNASAEPQKSGFAREGFLDAAAALPPAPHLRLVGLMTIGPAGDPEAARPGFRALRECLHALHHQPALAARFPAARLLSMGMSGDFEMAVEEGAHYLRIGTALFGPRT